MHKKSLRGHTATTESGGWGLIVAGGNKAGLRAAVYFPLVNRVREENELPLCNTPRKEKDTYFE